MRLFRLLLLLPLWFSTPVLFGQTVSPTPPVITLVVDASEAPQKIFHSRMTIPVSAGPLTLNYPKWIPGEHAPSGPVAATVGLFFSAGGQALRWRRDSLDMFTYELDIPEGVSSLDIDMDYLSPVETPGGFTSGASASEQLAVVSWNQLLLYPKGWSAEQVRVSASLRLPDGWRYGTALPVASDSGNSVRFATASLATTIDSPVLIGRYFSVVQLQRGQSPAHEIDIAADSEAALHMTESDRQAFNNLVAEAGALFGARHYRDYHFLLSLSSHVSHFGLEHHESSDCRTYESYLMDPSLRIVNATLLPHEYVHSWNGKYRLPAGIATSDYQTPLRDDLLWVYEGLTDYYGMVLTARSRLLTPEQFRDQLGIIAMELSYRTGRRWRSLGDTAIAAQVLYDAPQAWTSWRRGLDFYNEGALVWLDADVLIRRQTQGRKSLDDFARLFFGGESGTPTVKTYTLDDVINALDQVLSYDWRKFFRERVDLVDAKPPLGGITAGGWMVIYTDKPSELMQIRQDIDRTLDVTASIGLNVQGDGLIIDAAHDMPAAKAGIAPGMKLIAVNGRKFTPRVLFDALQSAKDSKTRTELLLENADYYRTVSLDYHDGPRYPHVVRDESLADLLSGITTPRASIRSKSAAMGHQ